MNTIHHSHANTFLSYLIVHNPKLFDILHVFNQQKNYSFVSEFNVKGSISQTDKKNVVQTHVQCPRPTEVNDIDFIVIALIQLA